MSDVVAAPVVTETPVVEAPTPDITGEQAKAMVEAEKARANGIVPEGATKEEAREAIRKYKLKVDGEEVEVDEEELKRGYSHQRAANKILQEGRLARKQAEEFLAMMRDPNKLWEVAQKLGHDPRSLAEKHLVSQLEDEMLDPREKELRQVKRELEQIKEIERQQKEEVERQRNEALKAKYAKDYSDQFVAALQETGLPPTKPMVSEMAKYIGRAAELGFKMTAHEAAQLVKEDTQMAYQRLIGDADGEMLLKLIGEETANKVRKYDVSKIRTPESMLRTPDQQGEPRARKTSHKRMSASEWRKFNGRG